jgi:hypothetical protein
MKKLPSAFSEATTDENKLKNRYLNVLPCNYIIIHLFINYDEL